MADESEWLKLPADDKVLHKAWKARVAGYDECIKLFPTLDEKSPEFNKFLGCVKKMVIDNNAIAQEKALEAVLLFVENAHCAGRTVGEVASGVITKCLNASRAKTKERGMDILLMYIEIEKQEVVQDELMKGLTNKQPKIVAGCIQTFREAIRVFGTKVITVKPIVKTLQKLLEDRDKVVREEAKLLTIEIYHWVGAPIKPQLANLKPVQLTELEAEFEKLPSQKPQQSRFLRSQQDLKAKFEEQEAAGPSVEDQEEEEEDAAEVDPFEMLDPVDILSKLPKDFYDKIEAKKWQERREALEAVEKLVENPKLEQGDYHDLVKAIKKVISKDTNIMLVVLAAKCMKGLASGLRKKFANYAQGATDAILEKFREKKPHVVAILREAVDTIFETTTLEAVSEISTTALEHKTPSVKAETALYLSRCFSKSTPTTLPKKLLKMFVAPLLKMVTESQPEVREASYAALGMAMKVVGEKHLLPFLADVDPLKMAKIKECCESAVLIRGGKPVGGAAAASAPAASARPSTAPAKKDGPKTVKGGGGAKKEEIHQPSPVKDLAESDRPKTAPATAAKSGKQAGKKGGKGGKKGAGGGGEEKEELILADEVAEERAIELLQESVVKGLANANWKERLAAMEKFTENMKGRSRGEIPAQVCVRAVTKKPGLKDNNFQVLKLRIELLAHIAKNSEFSKTSANFCITDLVDKLGDVKNGAAVKETLSCIAEACKLEFVSQQVIVTAFENKNPKNQAEALNWLAGAVTEFGFKVNVKPMIQYIKKAFAATNPAVRASAINVVSSIYLYMGPTLRVFFEDEKAALLQQIDTEFEKLKGQKPPAPIRGLAPNAGVEEGEEAEEEDGGAAEGINVADLIPRNDISAQITPELLTEMADKNWKIRNEALQKVTAILNEAKFITSNIGGLPEALKLRLGDSNKILVTTTLTICTTLATAMGPNIKNHVRIIGPGIVGCCGDSKPQIRAAAVACLNTWLEHCTLHNFVEAEIFSEALKLENPNLRSELLGWLAEKLPDRKKLPPELKECIPYLFASLEDRNGGVRQKAQEALVPFMIHTGYDFMVKKAGNLKPSSKDQVLGLLEKAKVNLPAKAPPKAKAAAPAKMEVPAAPASTTTSNKSSPVDDEPSSESSSAPASKVVKGKAGKAPAGKKVTGGSKKKEEEADLSPLLKVGSGKDSKEQRFKDEKNLKVLKWNFTAPRAEFVEQLKTQMETTTNTTLMEQLFHNDFKQHIKAIDSLAKAVEAYPDATMTSLDMILKWMTLRFFDTNTSVLLKALEYMQGLFNMLAENDYHLQDLEANSFVPYLINKVGDPKDNVRRDIRIIFKLICKVYPASKMFSLLIEGLKSKNSKQRTECLEELGSLIEGYGINVCQPSPAQALKLIAGQIGDRDNSVRSAALNSVVAAYWILGETVYKYIGNLNDKDMSMLEERIKRSSKSRPSSTVGKISPDEPTKTAAKPLPGQKEPVKMRENASDIKARSAAPKRFTLEMQEDDGPEPEMPALVQHDLKEILDEPIILPKTRLRPPSPSMRLLHGSSDVKSAIDLVISQIASNEILTSKQALAQIDELLKDPEKWEMMTGHVDQLLVVCSLQLRMAYTKYLGDTDTNKEEVLSLDKCLLSTILDLLTTKNLGKEASRDVLKDLLYNLITVLLDQRLTELEEGPQVIRTVNIVVVKVVQNTDPTNSMSALIKLLHESIANEYVTPNFVELIMKCLWKMIRMLPNIVNELNVDRILQDLHLFLRSFPSHSWKSRPSDVPLRTVRTILHTVARLKGNRIMSHLTLIENPQSSEVESYLQKVLKNGVDNNMISNDQHNNENINGNDAVELRTPRKDTNKTKRLSKTTHDMLAEIFKKIGSKENTREGLNDLYDFKDKYPEADLEPFLKKSSQFFQNYIERGLKNIEVEREGKLKPSNQSSALNTQSTNTGSSGGGEEINPAVYMERLKVLRARCGLDNAKLDHVSNSAQENQDPSPPSSQAEPQLPELHIQPSQPVTANEDTATSTATLADLKKRLERIKNSTKN